MRASAASDCYTEQPRAGLAGGDDVEQVPIRQPVTRSGERDGEVALRARGIVVTELCAERCQPEPLGLELDPGRLR